MAGVSQFIFYLYVLTIVFLACICEASVNQVRSAFRFLSTSVRHPIATARFITLLDEKNPATRYKIEKREEPTECVVCLSRLEKGDKIRKLKCNHMFHKVCVDTWLQRDLAVACPICRAAVLPEEIVLKLRQRENGDQADGGSDQEIIFLSLLQGIEGEIGEELSQQGDRPSSE